MPNQLPKRMRYKGGKYYFICFDKRWRELGSNLTEALTKYLELYGDYCSPETRDTVTDLYLSAIKR